MLKDNLSYKDNKWVIWHGRSISIVYIPLSYACVTASNTLAAVESVSHFWCRLWFKVSSLKPPLLTKATTFFSSNNVDRYVTAPASLRGRSTGLAGRT